MKPLRLLLLASDRGSHAVNLIQATRDGRISGTVVRVITDRERAPVLDRAAERGVPTTVLRVPGTGARLDPASESELIGIIAEDHPDLIALCGFMRILSPEFLRRVGAPVLNVHPSLLPRFRGLNAQRRAIEAGVSSTGASVHYVDAGVDTGPIVLQAELAIRPGETPEELSDRLLPLEHRLYVEAIQKIQKEKE